MHLCAKPRDTLVSSWGNGDRSQRSSVEALTRLCMASEARNSRTLLRRTLRPSAVREKGVSPAPFSCISQRAPAAFTTCIPTTPLTTAGNASSPALFDGQQRFECCPSHIAFPYTCHLLGQRVCKLPACPKSAHNAYIGRFISVRQHSNATSPHTQASRTIHLASALIYPGQGLQMPPSSYFLASLLSTLPTSRHYISAQLTSPR